MTAGLPAALMALGLGLALAAAPLVASAQTPPSADERAAYQGLHRAAAQGDLEAIRRQVGDKAAREARDGNGRTPLHVAAFARQAEAAQALMAGGADANALDHQRYDIITIAAVTNDLVMLKTAIGGGANPRNVTSPYDGTALIAAAHLGHAEVVETLIQAGAPLDHVNNLGWTALIEAVILGDGGANHQRVVRALLAAGADRRIADRQGRTPLDHARARGYGAMIAMLEGR